MLSVTCLFCVVAAELPKFFWYPAYPSKSPTGVRASSYDLAGRESS